MAYTSVEEQKGLMSVWLRRFGYYDLCDLTRFPYFYSDRSLKNYKHK